MDRIDSIPITKDFYNSETNAPFTTCLMCNQSLEETMYVVEKSFRNIKALNTREIIFEYAMCMNCASTIHFELSEESRARIGSYMAAHVQRKEYFASSFEEERKSILGRCIVHSTSLEQSTEYSIYALCNGHQMLLGEFPYALSGEAQDEIMQLLSAKSLEIMDDFIGSHFSGPPEVMEILRRRPILI